ncbi:MAG: alpha-2-macroglobulin family protein, partial [Bacteroidota bacterium]
FILEDYDKVLPEKYPVVFELRNPDYQLVNRLVQQKNALGFYSFKFKTDADAPTGSYQVLVEAGGVSFSKYLSIETIKPNRLKIEFNFQKKFLTKQDPASATMHVKWLHGAIAKNLDARVEVILKPASIFFEKLKDYTFDDPSKSYYSESEVIFDESLDEYGNAEILAEISTSESAPGKLNATFFTKVFEKGGDFSIDQFTIPYYAYESFVGIKMPKGDKARQMLLTDTTHTVSIVTVDANGNLVKDNHQIEMTVYKVDWRWWWDQSSENLSSYNGRSYIHPMERETITTKGGKASWGFRINYPDWGRYLIRAYDKVTGHTSAKTVYIDWPGWAGRSQKDQPGGATMLTFSADKEKYTIGEKVNLTIPSGSNGRALVSIENGSKVVETYWVETQTGETQFSFNATKQMTPNVYVNVTLVQPHAQTLNDLPIRMFGIVPILVEDPASHLEPVLTMPDILKSEENVTIKVNEKSNKEMTYTIAIVDEGLLDITRFATPDPWNHFYAKEALGVKTWDIYDHVIGAFGGELERILAVGGGNEGEGESGKKANRFKPMVKFLGPFHLKGGSNSHTVEIPKYIGSVRTMVIAGHEKAYGSAEKTTPVIKPLMLLGTLPRVLGPGETVKLPVSIFAMEKNIKNVSVQIKTNKFLKVIGDTKKAVNFQQTGEEFIEFDIEVQQLIGIGKVEILAVSGNEKASYDIELDVRNPNPRVTDVISQIIESGSSWNQEITPVGISGTNKGILEVSSIPPLNLEKRLKFLIKYPHGCIEQTTSSAFPQLYLDVLVELNETQKKDISRNIKDAILRIQSFQMYNGGLGYWPGATSTCEWGTNYAGHFILEASKKGYTVSSSFLKNWKKYQKSKA